MTLTLNLPPEIEQAYRAEARAKGVPLDQLIRDLAVAPVRPAPLEMSSGEWIREFKTWTRSHAADNLPVRSDEAVSRDFIYRDRGL